MRWILSLPSYSRWENEADVACVKFSSPESGRTETEFRCSDPQHPSTCIILYSSGSVKHIALVIFGCDACLLCRAFTFIKEMQQKFACDSTCSCLNRCHVETDFSHSLALWLGGKFFYLCKPLVFSLENVGHEWMQGACYQVNKVKRLHIPDCIVELNTCLFPLGI